jgi:hypothetical protein
MGSPDAEGAGADGVGKSHATQEELRQLLSTAIHGEHSAVWIDDQLRAGGPFQVSYPKLQLVRPPLQVTLHMDSLADTTGEMAELCAWLANTGKHTAYGESAPDIDLALTAYRDANDVTWARGIKMLGQVTQGSPAAGFVSFAQLYQESQRADWEQVRTVQQPPANFLDMRLHQLEKRHLFVTLDRALLDIGLQPQRSPIAFAVDPFLAQRYVSLYLKAYGAYRVMPNFTVNRGLYYWMRLWNLVPAFQAAWPYVVFGVNVAPHGQEIYAFLQALHARLTGMMQAHDRLGWFRYTPADNDTRDEMLNELNYFIVLATGIFDSIAWLASHRFQINEPNRNAITIRAPSTPNSRSASFFTNLETEAPTLVTYLRNSARQARIDLFYQPRDAIQHRLVLTGAHFNTGRYLSDCNVVFPDSATVQAIQQVDSHDKERLPFSAWGLIYADEAQPLLEPFRCSGEALRFVFSFVDGALTHLDLASWLSPFPQLKREAEIAAQEARKENCVSFAVPFL